MSEYPEHDKLEVVGVRTQAVGDFLDWVSAVHDAQLMVYDRVHDEWYPPDRPLMDLLAGWVGVDRQKLEVEKIELITELRELSKLIEKEDEE